MRTIIPFIVLAIAIGASAGLGQTTSRVSVDSVGVQGNASSGNPSISADGRFVAFESSASNLVPGDANYDKDVFVHDRQTGQTVRTSVDSAGVEGNRWSVYPSISVDGRFVAFGSYASNLVPLDLNGWDDVFITDRETGRITLVSVNSAGSYGNSSSDLPSISGDGRFVAFVSSSSNLVSGDTNRAVDVFVRDVQAGVTTRVSVDSSGGQASDESYAPSISADGRFVAFASWASNLVPADSGRLRDVFVHDRQTGETTRVSVDSSGGQANGESDPRFPSISGDGRFVAFISYASNLVSADTNGAGDVFVHDRQTGETTRVSVDSAGVEGDRNCIAPSVSGDGRFVAFYSFATNLIPDDTNLAPDVFVHDRQTSETKRVSVDSAGVQGNGGGYYNGDTSSVSSDGRFVAFFSNASNLVPADTNSTSDVFVRDVSSVSLASVAPVVGSERGSDFVHFYGRGFTSIADTTVSFADAVATVLSVSPDRIDVRTPPGTGVASVTVTNSIGTATLPSGYTYVAPELAARYGNVNQGRGDREDVLLVNAVIGDAASRTVTLSVGQPLTAVMLAPSSRSTSRFVLYGWGREPIRATLTPLPRHVGSLVCAPPFLGGVTTTIWNNLGYRGVLGSPTYPARPAPSAIVRSTATQPLVLTLQGIVEDDASPSGTGFSVTNAIVVRVTP